jgi:hypothetical protein
MWKAVVGMGGALKALVSTLTDRVKQQFGVSDTKKVVYADLAYNLSMLLEAKTAPMCNHDIPDLRRLRIEDAKWGPWFSLLREVNTVRLICDKLEDLRDVSHFAVDEFPQQLDETLTYFDGRMLDGELDKKRLLKFANLETKRHVESLFRKH